MIKYFSPVLCDCHSTPAEGIQWLWKILDFLSATGTILRKVLYQFTVLYEDHKEEYL